MAEVDGLHMAAAKRAHLGREACFLLELRNQPGRAMALRAVTVEDTATWMSTCQVCPSLNDPRRLRKMLRVGT